MASRQEGESHHEQDAETTASMESPDTHRSESGDAAVPFPIPPEIAKQFLKRFVHRLAKLGLFACIQAHHIRLSKR